MVSVDLSVFELHILEIALSCGIETDKLPENIRTEMLKFQEKISRYLDTLEV